MLRRNLTSFYRRMTCYDQCKLPCRFYCNEKKNQKNVNRLNNNNNAKKSKYLRLKNESQNAFNSYVKLMVSKSSGKKQGQVVEVPEYLKTTNKFSDKAKSSSDKVKKPVEVATASKYKLTTKSARNPKTFSQRFEAKVIKLAKTMGQDVEATKTDLKNIYNKHSEKKGPSPKTGEENYYTEINFDTSSYKKELNEIHEKESNGKSDYFLEKSEETDKSYFEKYQNLGIFTKASGLSKEDVSLKTWERLKAMNLEELLFVPPSNHFEEMIEWTKQGKLWHFPIDNEQGMYEEMGIDFSEHVFLDKHLEPWCPTSGPLRDFMELVIVGLSKNNYLSVQEKKDTIMWYKNYFEGKKELLRDSGLIPEVEKAPSEEAKAQE